MSTKPPRTPQNAAREAVLQMLYAIELDHQDPAEVQRWYLEAHPLAPAAGLQAEALLASALTHRPQIEALISRHANGWSLARISPIDRSLLILGCAELLSGLGRRAMFKAILALADRFTQDEAKPFINAVLEAIARELTGEAVEGAKHAAKKAVPETR